MERSQLVQDFITRMDALKVGGDPPTLDMIEAAFNYVSGLRQVSTVRHEMHLHAWPIIEQFAFTDGYAGDLGSLSHIVNLILDLENNKPVPGMPASPIGIPTKFDAVAHPVQPGQMAQVTAQPAGTPSGYKMTAEGLVPDPWAGTPGYASNPELVPPGVTVATNGAGNTGAGHFFAPAPVIAHPMAAHPAPMVPQGPLYLYSVQVGDEPAESVVAPTRGAAIAKSKLMQNLGEEGDEPFAFTVKRVSEVTI